MGVRTIDALVRVYPRVGGGTGLCPPVQVGNIGLSPRGRGNRDASLRSRAVLRSIPAWAGEPGRDLHVADRQRVYPRVGGGTGRGGRPKVDERGLSPRGRGNPRLGPRPGPGQGSIPAWAGEPGCHRGTCRSWRVYPRVGGGTAAVLCAACRITGLSPRGRGNPDVHPHERVFEGSIPAWAGEPRSLTIARSIPWVYPRVGGGTETGTKREPSPIGLSPRGRGNPSPNSSARSDTRSIPAWAGEPTEVVVWAVISGVYPRVGGGTGGVKCSLTFCGGLSPRGRGNPLLPEPWGRSIPAWAGEPSGKGLRLRSIPAWAGEPARVP